MMMDCFGSASLKMSKTLTLNLSVGVIRQTVGVEGFEVNKSVDSQGSTFLADSPKFDPKAIGTPAENPLAIFFPNEKERKEWQKRMPTEMATKKPTKTSNSTDETVQEKNVNSMMQAIARLALENPMALVNFLRPYLTRNIT